MIESPLALFAVLAALTAAVQAARRAPALGKIFSLLPVPFWCYFLPMIGATFGLFPAESPLYGFLSRWALPLCLALLLVHVDLRALLGLGREALWAMGAGAAGIMAGAAASFALFHEALPPESWRAVGALSGSWIGGSANMLALKEALAAPESVFAPAVITDTVFAYSWMALLVALAGSQARFDRWNGAREPAAPAIAAAPRPGGAPFAAALLASALLAIFAVTLSDRLPALGSGISKSGWSVLLVTTASLAAAASGRFSGPAAAPCEKGGTAILYILVASMGARARLTAIVEAPLFLALGAVWLAVHAGVLLLVGRWRRSPLFLLAAASQACVGGAVSAPVVAAVYRPPLAAVGLLLAVLGNVAGTYLGLVTARICEWIAR